MKKLTNYDEIINLKVLNINGSEFKYCGNVLLSLGLSENFILFNNHYFFGFNDIDDQVVIKHKFEGISRLFDFYLNKLYKKYNREHLIIGLGGIYSKLEQIRIMNSNLKLEQINDTEQIKDISYPCSVADLMGRKIKYIIETTILRDNKKSYSFCFSNYDYKKFIILLYYYSIFTFYYSREHLSKDYENGVADFYIFPNDLEPICTLIQNQVNSTSKTNSFINYDSGIGNTTDAEFNEAFYCEKGISFDNFNNLMNGFIESSGKKNLTKSKISKEQLDLILLNTYPNINLDTFHKECILNKFNIEYDEKNLYKNNSKHRLDTTPIIDIGKDYYIIVKGFIINCKNYWNNVHSIGLTPYISEKKDKILSASEKIVNKITKRFEKDVAKIFKDVNPDVNIYTNKKTKDIFSKKDVAQNEWDIIVVDMNKHIIFNVEAKFLSTSLTESGLSNDLKKFIGNSDKNYVKKFEKRISIINDNLDDFISFCNADKSYKIENIMVVSKVIDLNIESPKRNFKIIHYAGLQEYLLNTYYKT